MDLGDLKSKTESNRTVFSVTPYVIELRKRMHDEFVETRIPYKPNLREILQLFPRA